MAEGTILDLDALFDKKMNEVPTAPDFVNPPAGHYALSVKEAKPEKYKTKAKDNKPEENKTRIRVLLAVENTITLGDNTQPPVSNGSLFSMNYNADEEGLSYFKAFALKVAGMTEEQVADVSFKDIMNGLTDLKFEAAITVVKTANPAGGFYENVRVRVTKSAAD